MREDKLLRQFSRVLKRPEVRTLMIKMVVRNIYTWIEILRNQVRGSEFYKHFETESFEWSSTKFLDRINVMENYMNILRLEDARSVDLLKFMLDMEKVEHLLGEITTSNKDAIVQLNDCHQALELKESLTSALELNTKLFEKQNRDMEELIEEMNSAERREEDRCNQIIDDSMDEVLIKDPFTERYLRKLMQVEFNELENKVAADKLALDEKIVKEIQRFDVLQRTYETTRQLLFMQTGELREKVHFWTKKYEIEFEKHSNKNRELKLKVDAMKSNYETLVRNIEYFKYELSHLKSIEPPLTAEQKERICQLYQKKPAKQSSKKKQQKLRSHKPSKMKVKTS